MTPIAANMAISTVTAGWCDARSSRLASERPRAATPVRAPLLRVRIATRASALAVLSSAEDTALAELATLASAEVRLGSAELTRGAAASFDVVRVGSAGLKRGASEELVRAPLVVAELTRGGGGDPARGAVGELARGAVAEPLREGGAELARGAVGGLVLEGGGELPRWAAVELPRAAVDELGR